MNMVQRREDRRIDRLSNAGQFDGEFTIDEEYVLARFEEAAHLQWGSALLIVGLELGLLDVGGSPKSAWAKRVINEGRKAYRRARKLRLRCLKLRGLANEAFHSHGASGYR
jgi:hypothetical protein